MSRRGAMTAVLLIGGTALGGCADTGSELPPSLAGLTLDTLFEVGAASGDAWEAFEGVWDIEVDGDGRLAILDLGGPAVHVFDDEGSHVATMDDTGLEAGQLDRPSGIAWSEPGALLVWDPGSSWVSRFEVGGSAMELVDHWRAFAFGETGFCAAGDRTFLSYLQAGQVVHEIGSDGPVRSFGAAPSVAGAETLGPELREIAVEELTPSALLCTSSGVLDVSFMQSVARLHDWDGTAMWSHELDGVRPIVVYTDDGIGLGRAFDEGEGSHLLRSVVPWGDSMALVQHELRTRESPDEGEEEVFESRLLDLADGSEVARTRDLPLVLAAQGRRLYLVRQSPFPAVTVVEVR